MLTSALLSPTREESTEPVVEGPPEDSDDTFPNPLFSSPSSPRRSRSSRSSRSKDGPWSKRLRGIRDSVKGDAVRFQSGQYPFSASSVDMNDPRNRAMSYLDVTILGSPAARQNYSQLVTLLGYVHAFVLKGEKRVTTENSTPAVAGNNNTPQSQMAWICLGCATARERKVGLGTQLRIYNAVPVLLATPRADNNSPQWAILATSLCEPYPSALPKLQPPEMHALLPSRGHGEKTSPEIST